MGSPAKPLCAQCFKSVENNFIKCHICRCKFHLICVEVDDNASNVFKDNKNMVYNCNKCLNTSSHMMSLISSLSSELREIKQSFISTILTDVKELKLRFNELTNNLDKSKTKKKKQNKNISNKPANVIKQNNNNASQQSLADVIVGASNASGINCNDGVSTVSSFPNAYYEVESNMSETDHQETGFQTVRRRKRKNRILVVGNNETNDIGVVAKKKFVHVSSFKTSVTADNIIEHIDKNSEIGKHHLECTRLTKKDVDVNTLKHVNFKLGVSPCFYDEIIKPSLWPVGTKIRPFVFFPKKMENQQNAT